MKPTLNISKSKKQVNREQRKEKIAALDKKKKQEITLDVVYEQNKLILEMLGELVSE